MGILIKANWVDGRSKEEIHTEMQQKELGCVISWLEDSPPEEHDLYLASPVTKSVWLCKRRIKPCICMVPNSQGLQ